MLSMMEAIQGTNYSRFDKINPNVILYTFGIRNVGEVIWFHLCKRR